MKTKFIGIDGFGEIESVKTTRKRKSKKGKSLKKFVKISRQLISESAVSAKESRDRRKAQKPTRLELHYANQRSRGADTLSSAAIAGSARAVKLSDLRKKSSPRPVTNILRNKAVLGVATFAVAVTLSAFAANNVLSFNAFASDVNEAKSEKVYKVSDNSLSRTMHYDISRSMADEDILTDGYGLYIDKKLVGVTLDKEELEKGLQKLLDDYKAKYDDTTTDEFANEVEILFGSYKSESVDDTADIIKNNKDKFSYALTTDIEYTQSIPYETVVTYDDDEYVDYRETVQKGKRGREKVIYRVTFTDGLQTDAELSDIITLKKAQDKLVVQGTKERPTEAPAVSYYDDDDYSYSGSTGGFIWPVTHTYNVTSEYGPRWGTNHTGIDIAGGGDYGQPIIASDSGTVEWAGYDNSGYGNYVIINHHNGYKTLYGHCSELYVSCGQSVSQGETIAAIGSTGMSTGPHLHFEVRTEYGDRLNPRNFV